MQVVLVMFTSDGERRSFSLPREVTVIGRREDCDLRIPLAEVSRKHCRFVAENNTLRLEDLGSSNGTFHNGVRIQEAVVQPGDLVQIGPIVFVVQIDGVPPDEQIQPALSSDKDDTSVHAGMAATAETDPLTDSTQDDIIDLDLEDLADQPDDRPAPDQG